ncbi:site-2 protease family protein, partial [Pseudomonas lactis]|uniref:site-2 protease family protein n=1 Tax=Pseudomonas lactis TaxID=1615674 RepID=UPI001F2E3584
MSALYMIVGTLVALGVLVTFHEFGHFWVARRCGVKVLRFSVGFGMPLLRWHDRRGTEFVIAAIPLGGYVKMLDEREGEVPADQLDQSFNRKTVRQRIAIVAAGARATFLFAVGVFLSSFHLFRCRGPVCCWWFLCGRAVLSQPQ